MSHDFALGMRTILSSPELPALGITTFTQFGQSVAVRPGAVGDTLINSTYVVVNNSYILTAHYAMAHRVVVQENPLRDDVGWILIDTDYHDIGVPSVDTMVYGKRYVFDYWSDGGDTVHRVGPISQ